MNKILILEPFYTNFHIDLAHSLSNNIYSFIFNSGNLIYLKGSKKRFVHQHIINTQYPPADLFIAKNTKSLYTEILRKISRVEPSESDFEYMAKYISYLRHFIIDKKIDLLLMHNDLRWQHALAIKVCKELGIRYLVTERGLFRPDTTTVELLGVNANSSLPRDANFYRSSTCPSICLNSYKVKALANFTINLKFFIFVVLNKLGNIFSINSPLINKKYQFRNYFPLIFKQKTNLNKYHCNEFPNKYIFIPLQVNSDTQILVHSEYNNMQQFITQVENAFYVLNSDCTLVFKVHPMERIDSYVFDKRSMLSNAKTNVLIKNSEFIITINSTVGFEAVQSYKKVIVLGDAFYKINGIAVCSSIESFQDDLLSCLDNNVIVDKDLIIKFVSYLRAEYQINGSLFNYDSKMFRAIKQLLVTNK